MSDVRITRPSDSATTMSLAPASDHELEAIRQRAYELFCARGDQPGNELDDWLTAEYEILTQASAEVSDQDDAYDVDVSLPGFSAGDVEIVATETELLVHALMATSEAATTTDAATIDFTENEVYRRIRMPTPISFERISAEFNDGVLHLHAPKSTARAALATA